MKFYSHAKEKANGSRLGTKLLSDHFKNVSQIAKKSIYNRASTSISKNSIYLIINDICFFHDLGKYTEYFQIYLLKKGKIDIILKQHAKFGAYSIFQKYLVNDSVLAVIAYFIIVNHHQNLHNILNTEFSVNSNEIINKPIFNSQLLSIEEKIHQIKNEIGKKELQDYFKYPDSKTIRQIIKNELVHKSKSNIQNYFLTNYLFSLLIEADKLDASDTPIYYRKPISANAVDIFIGQIDESKLGKIKTLKNQNELRNYVRLNVVNQLENKEILKQKIFTLTAPTGIGKTLTSLDFALRLKEIIRKEEKREAQIIYALPFINIIEQGLDVYKKVLPNEVNILAHYQYADVFGEQDKHYNDEEEYNQKLMTLDTWQSDIVITSFVQFFETLIGNRNKLLKKFNHYAGSIIILDEVQTIRLELMPLIGAALYYLAKFLGSRIILMTATKPKIFELAFEEILKDERVTEKHKISKELLNDHNEVFKKFSRTRIIPLLENPLNNEDDFIEIFNEKWNKNKSCLVVCNTVKRSISVYNKIKDSKTDYPIYYLSTNIVPSERLYIIGRIKLDLKYGKNPVLVSTQVVEAGVDLDFDIGFRDLGPIDSIVQVAGRINRENDIERKESPLYVIEFVNEKGCSDCSRVYDPITYSQSKKAIESYEYINESDYLKLVDDYFKIISDPERNSYRPSRKIFESMKTLKYDGENEEYPVSSFKIIKEQNNVVSVFIEIDEKATKVKNAFLRLLKKEITRKDFEIYKKDFHQRIITVPKFYIEKRQLSDTLTENIYYVRKELLDDYYDKDTGFIRFDDDETTVML